MKASAAYFGFCFAEAKVRFELEQIAHRHLHGSWKVRLLVSRSGEVRCEIQDRENLSHDVLRVAMAAKPVTANDRFLFHKTTNRSVYDDALASRPDCDDVILWNEAGEVTEATIANVVVSLGGRLYTPPRQAGLLAGTLRAELLAAGKIVERVINKAELFQATEIFLINSVSGWRQAALVP
jgi:para-aminobenzoate synthetase/4-amino-4-deoxychorismate lyase